MIIDDPRHLDGSVSPLWWLVKSEIMNSPRSICVLVVWRTSYAILVSRRSLMLWLFITFWKVWFVCVAPDYYPSSSLSWYSYNALLYSSTARMLSYFYFSYCILVFSSCTFRLISDRNPTSIAFPYFGLGNAELCFELLWYYEEELKEAEICAAG